MAKPPLKSVEGETRIVLAVLRGEVTKPKTANDDQKEATTNLQNQPRVRNLDEQP